MSKTRFDILPGSSYAFVATPQARAALAEVQAQHGALMFHRVAGAGNNQLPILLPAGELILGARDWLVGHVEGVPVFEMESTESAYFGGGTYSLDIERGLPVGFSLGAGHGWRFTFTLQGAAACPAPIPTRKDPA